MKRVLVAYTSKTGFTRKYVEWISESMPCHVVPLSQLSDTHMSGFDVIVYGGGIHAGQIQALKDFKKSVVNLLDKRIVVFATGGAPATEEIVSKIRSNNFGPDDLGDIEFFYFQSGLNYEKMGAVDKTIMKAYNRVLALKSKKSAAEAGTSAALSGSYDNSSRESIKPLVDSISRLLDR